MSEKYSSLYDDFYYLNERQYIVNQVNRNLSPVEIKGKDILDYGCGAGCASSYFFEFKPSSITGIDISRKAIDLAKSRTQNLPALSFIRGDINSMV